MKLCKRKKKRRDEALQDSTPVSMAGPSTCYMMRSCAGEATVGGIEAELAVVSSSPTVAW